MLSIKDLTVSIQNTPIVKNLSLDLPAGEFHVLMGPNGSGKSTLAATIAGHPDYQIENGTIYFQGEDLANFSPHERALKGIFLTFQQPVEIPGLSLMSFLKNALNAKRKSQQLPEIDAADFLKEVKDCVKQVGLDESFLYRSLNDGFSGGEKKRCEILQLLVLKPSLVIMDEIDSGLDVDALKMIASVIRDYKNQNNSFLVITHYQRLLDLLQPDCVHIFGSTGIKKSGKMEIVTELEKEGYQKFFEGAS